MFESFLLKLIPKPLSLIGVLALILMGCAQSSEPSTECSCDCKPPERGSMGIHIPALTHRGAKCSPNGKKLAFVINDGAPAFGLLDLTTHKTMSVYLKDILPNYPTGGSLCDEVFWSPYSSDRIYLHCVEFYDSSGSTLYIQNAYIYDFRSSKAVRI